MAWMIPLMVGGAVMSKMQGDAQRDAENKAMFANAEMMRYSPWTGMKTSMMKPTASSEIMDMGKGALSGAMFAQGLGGGGAAGAAGAGGGGGAAQMAGLAAASQQQQKPMSPDEVSLQGDLLQRGQYSGRKAQQPSFYSPWGSMGGMRS